MQLQKLTRDLDQLSIADATVVESYLRTTLKKTALFALSGLFCLLGLAALGISIFWLLEPTYGISGASAVVGLLSCAFALVGCVLAVRVEPGREYQLALELRRSAIRTLQEDLSLEEAASKGHYMMGDVLASAVVVPLLASLLRGIRGMQSTKAVARQSEQISKID